MLGNLSETRHRATRCERPIDDLLVSTWTRCTRCRRSARQRRTQWSHGRQSSSPLQWCTSTAFPLPDLSKHMRRDFREIHVQYTTDVCVGQRPLIIYSQLRPNLHALKPSLQGDHRGLARSRRPQGLRPRGLGARRRGRLVLLHYVPLLLSRSGRQMTARLAYDALWYSRTHTISIRITTRTFILLGSALLQSLRQLFYRLFKVELTEQQSHWSHWVSNEVLYCNWSSAIHKNEHNLKCFARGMTHILFIQSHTSTV